MNKHGEIPVNGEDIELYNDFNEIQIEYMREPDVTLPKENLVKMVNFYD